MAEVPEAADEHPADEEREKGNPDKITCRARMFLDQSEANLGSTERDEDKANSIVPAGGRSPSFDLVEQLGRYGTIPDNCLADRPVQHHRSEEPNEQTDEKDGRDRHRKRTDHVFVDSEILIHPAAPFP